MSKIPPSIGILFPVIKPIVGDDKNAINAATFNLNINTLNNKSFSNYKKIIINNNKK